MYKEDSVFNEGVITYSLSATFLSANKTNPSSRWAHLACFPFALVETIATNAIAILVAIGLVFALIPFLTEPLGQVAGFTLFGVLPHIAASGKATYACFLGVFSPEKGAEILNNSGSRTGK